MGGLHQILRVPGTGILQVTPSMLPPWYLVSGIW